MPVVFSIATMKRCVHGNSNVYIYQTNKNTGADAEADSVSRLLSKHADEVCCCGEAKEATVSAWAAE